MSVLVNTSVITNAGLSDAITNGTQGLKVQISSFQIGSALITPQPTMTGVTTLVYTGTADQITYSSNASTDEITFYVSLGETVGNFYIGNIGLFTTDGTMFAISALANQEYKLKTDTGTSPPTTGNSRIYAIVVALTNVQNLIDVSIISPAYASLPSVTTEAQLPSVNAAPYNAYIVETLSKTNTNSIAVTNGTNWIELYGILNTSDSAVVIPNLASFSFAEGSAICWTGSTFALWDPSSATNVYVGIVGQNDLVYRNGVFTISTGTPYTVGLAYYAGTGANAGILTTTPPISNNSFLQVGYALTSNSLALNAQCSEQIYQLAQQLANIPQLFGTSSTVTTPYQVLSTDNTKILYANAGTIVLPASPIPNFQIAIINTNLTNPLSINPNGIDISWPPAKTNTSSIVTLNPVNWISWVWLNYQGGLWRVLGGSTDVMNAAALTGNLANNFSGNKFIANSTSGYTFNNSAGYYYMDGSNAIIRTPVGGAVFNQDVGGNLVQSLGAPATGLSDFVTLGQFTHDITLDGYQELPSGLIIQWGTVYNITNTFTTITFPTQFPSACLMAIANEQDVLGTWGGLKPTIYGTSNRSTAGMTIGALLWSGSNWTNTESVSCSWIALGY
ncbi:MAG: phage tail protein [Rhodospirillales bacterium]|nr:phage tail protein [Rhodospirillales bacterium]